MSRIAKIAQEAWDPALKQLAGDAPLPPIEQGMMRMFAHNVTIAQGVAGLAGSFRAGRKLPQRLAELVRLRIAFHNQCRSCMAIRYDFAIADGVTEDLVCSLEKPMEAPDLTPAEKLAIAYADKFATNHLAIGDADYEALREYFDEAQIVELGAWCAMCTGFGRLAATWHMIEDLPAQFQAEDDVVLAPWGKGEPVIVR